MILLSYLAIILPLSVFSQKCHTLNHMPYHDLSVHILPFALSTIEMNFFFKLD